MIELLKYKRRFVIGPNNANLQFRTLILFRFLYRTYWDAVDVDDSSTRCKGQGRNPAYYRAHVFGQVDGTLASPTPLPIRHAPLSNDKIRKRRAVRQRHVLDTRWHQSQSRKMPETRANWSRHRRVWRHWHRRRTVRKSGATHWAANSSAIFSFRTLSTFPKIRRTKEKSSSSPRWTGRTFERYGSVRNGSQSLNWPITIIHSSISLHILVSWLVNSNYADQGFRILVFSTNPLPTYSLFRWRASAPNQQETRRGAKTPLPNHPRHWPKLAEWNYGLVRKGHERFRKRIQENVFNFLAKKNIIYTSHFALTSILKIPTFFSANKCLGHMEFNVRPSYSKSVSSYQLKPHQLIKTTSNE